MKIPQTIAQHYDDPGKDPNAPTQNHLRHQTIRSTPPPKYGKHSYVDLTHPSSLLALTPKPPSITPLDDASVKEASPQHNERTTYHHTPKDSDRTQHSTSSQSFYRATPTPSHIWTEPTSMSFTLDRILTQLTDTQRTQSSITTRLREVEKKLDRLIVLQSKSPPDYSSKIDSLSNFLLKLYESISRLEKNSSILYHRILHPPPR